MQAHDVIESWVRDVVARLPRRMRNDVAFELRMLLDEGLAAKAATAGRAPDRAMAMDLLREFGRPADVAARYHVPSAVVDTGDTHHFVIWSLAGAVVVSLHAALSSEAFDTGAAFLQWLGLLVLVFAAMGWWRRRSKEDAFGWRPSRGPDWMPRGLAVLSAFAMLVFPVFMYFAPQRFVDTLFFGAIPSSGLELAPAFEHSWQRTVTAALLCAMVGVQLAVAVQGGIRRWIRWYDFVVNAGLGLAFVAHAAPMTAADGGRFQVFVLDVANAHAAPIFNALGGMMLLFALYGLYLLWAAIDPAPVRRATAPEQAG